MHPPIAFGFELGSNDSYLSLMRIEALAARTKVPLRLASSRCRPSSWRTRCSGVTIAWKMRWTMRSPCAPDARQKNSAVSLVAMVCSRPFATSSS